MSRRRAFSLLLPLAAPVVLALLLLAIAPSHPVHGAPPLGSPQPPGVTPLGGILATDDTWGPGTLTVTADMLINPGVTIIITPHTELRMATADGANLGLDPNRVECLVAGTLQANGPVTFTSQSGSPACGDWVGIYFAPGSSGRLDHTIVEYGVHALEIATTHRITVANSILRHNCHVLPVGHAWGAGMAIYDGTHLITNTTIHDNAAQLTASSAGTWAEGGGVQMVSPAGPTLFENCRIYDNHASNYGFLTGLGGDTGAGAINVLAADPIVRHCEIYSNTSTADRRAFGGALYLGDSNALIEADTFIHDNHVSGGTVVYGGGICLSEAGLPAPARPVIRDSRVVSNTVTTRPPPPGYAGPRQILGGAIAFYENSHTRAVISHTLIAGNNVGGHAAACGGGIGMAKAASADRFDGNVIRDNQVSSVVGSAPASFGGGICLTSTNAVSVTNNLVYNNTAGAVVTAPPYGGGIYANGPRSYLVNNTIVSNTAYIAAPTTLLGQGGGVYLANGVLSNTIVAHNFSTGDGGGVYWAGGRVGHNDVWGNTCLFTANGCGADYATGGSPRPATDIDADPHFASSGDLAARYHLQPRSPCIDQGLGPGVGIPGIDYDRDPRPSDAGWDIGFDENSASGRRIYLPMVLKRH